MLSLSVNPYKAAATTTHNQTCKRLKITGKSTAGIQMEISGLDSNGRQFKNPDEMWKQEIGDSQKKDDWYKNGVGYWQGVEASMDGVLGGYSHVNEPDIKSSEAFLNTLMFQLFPNGGRDQHLVALG